MLLGSSGMVKRVKIPLKHVCENANSLTLKVAHLWGWHICKGVEEIVDGYSLWWILDCFSAFIQSIFVTPGFKGKSECKNTCAPGSSYTHASTQ
jgi:hypothetical protein